MKKMTAARAEQIYQQVANNNGVSIESVKKEIKKAMLIGMVNQDPKIQAKWNAIPHDGDVPTPEELLIYLTSQIQNR